MIEVTEAYSVAGVQILVQGDEDEVKARVQLEFEDYPSEGYGTRCVWTSDRRSATISRARSCE